MVATHLIYSNTDCEEYVGVGGVPGCGGCREIIQSQQEECITCSIFEYVFLVSKPVVLMIGT